MKLCSSAVWNNNDGARFFSLKGPGIFLANTRNEEVQTVTIDDMFVENRATYIKMSIEGAELRALQGAQKTIERYRPKLAIAGYHKTWDMWKVPKLVLKYNTSYSLSQILYESYFLCVLFCVDKLF